MHSNQRSVTDRSAQWDTGHMKHWGEEAVENAKKWQTDPDKKLRKKASECRTCYYLRRGRIGGCAMTPFPCGLCGEVQLAGSTNTDRLCLVCGIKHELCVYCGADVELRVRRKFELPPPVKVQACSFCGEFFPKEHVVLVAHRGFFCVPCKDANPVLSE